MGGVLRAVVVHSDRAAGGLARGLATAGQCALVVLGVHLAADNLDDRVLALLTAAQGLADQHLAEPLQTARAWLGRPPGAPPWDALPLAPLAATAALLVELLATALLWGGFLLSPRAPALDLRRYRAALSPRAIVLPLCLSGVLLAGAWSLSMALEDLLPAGPASRPAAALVGLATLARFGWPAWARTVACLEPPRRRAEGLPSALVLAPVGLLAWLHGVPIWGPLAALLLGGAP
ncbi:hypothetical protein L6R53_24090 [Myxococcota bacterium]|nr:hypothetical protein [Myxococcota bacterium]